MNLVHEQCLKVDSGIVLSQTGSKTGRVHQVHSLLAQQQAQAARPCCAPRLRVARASRLRVARASRLLPRAPYACCRAGPAYLLPRAPRVPARAVHHRPAPCAPPPAPNALACAPSLYCDTNYLPHALFTTIHQSVLQYSVHQPSTRSQYNKLYCNTVSSTASCLYCNTLDPLHTSSLVIQSTSLAHPRPLYHNTMPFLQYNWTVAQIIFCTKFIIIIIFFVSFFFISSYWKIKKKKKYIHLFFFFSFSIILK